MDAAGEVSHMRCVGNVLVLARNGLALQQATEVVVMDWEKSRVLAQLYLGPLTCSSLDVTPTRIAAALKDPVTGHATVLVWDYNLHRQVYTQNQRPLRANTPQGEGRSASPPRWK